MIKKLAPKSFFDIAMFRLIFTFCISMVTLIHNKPASFQTNENVESFMFLINTRPNQFMSLIIVGCFINL